MEFGAKSELKERDKIGDVRRRFRLFINKSVWTTQIKALWKSLWRSPEIIFTQNCLYLLKFNTRRLCWVKRRAEDLGCGSVSWTRQVPEGSSESEEHPGQEQFLAGAQCLMGTHTLVRSSGQWPWWHWGNFWGTGPGDLVLRKERWERKSRENMFNL